MTVTEITNLIQNYGVGGAFFIITSVTILTITKSKLIAETLSKHSDKIIGIFSKKKTIREITDSDITNHDIFNYIDFWIHSKIPTFQFSTEYRTLVFRKYLTLYLKSYKKNIHLFIESKDYQEMDDAKLSKSFIRLINDVIYDYEREAEESGIPKIIIEKMKVKNNDTISLTLDLIEGICSSQFYSYDKNLLKVYSILNIFLSILENTITSSEEVCDSINGQIRGFTYNGITEP